MGLGADFLQMGGFSLNLWTARIHYGLKSVVISVVCGDDEETQFKIDVGRAEQNT